MFRLRFILRLRFNLKFRLRFRLRTIILNLTFLWLGLCDLKFVI
jgi:hypothetical protein